MTLTFISLIEPNGRSLADPMLTPQLNIWSLANFRMYIMPSVTFQRLSGYFLPESGIIASVLIRRLLTPPFSISMLGESVQIGIMNETSCPTMPHSPDWFLSDALGNQMVL